MFGSTNPFGQSSSPFGSSQSVFGQQNNTSNNPFAPKPFGSPTPFGSQQTGNSVFGGTSTGVFGAAQTSSPFSSNTFGASSSPAFGTSMPAFGASSTPAFGNSSSSFGGSSVFGQKPAFGGFGSTPTQTSPFGSATQPSQPAFGSNTQQSQPAFGSSIFGSSTPFGASSQPAFGSTGTPAFGATSTPAFGATSTPAFGATSTPAFGAPSTPAFGATSTPAFGSTSTSAFGNTGGAFGMSNTSVFGGGGAFGASSSPVFGSSSTPAFGASSSPAFGASSTPGFSFGSTTQAFGQSSSAFGTSSPFGSTTSAFGGQSSAFVSQTPTQAFGSTGIGQSGFGGQRGGSRIASYLATVEADSGASGQPGKLESISAMAVYKDKSHEELRWEDYQLGDKGGQQASAPPSTGMPVFNSSMTQTNAFGQSSASPFSSPFVGAAELNVFGTSAPAFSAPTFSSSSSSSAPSIFGTSTPPFGTSSFRNTQPSKLFSSAAPTNAQSASAFGQNTAPFGQTAALSQSSLFSSPPSGLVGNIYSSGASLSSNDPTGFGQTAPSVSTPFQSAQPAQSSGTFSFSNFDQTQPAGASSSGGTPGMFGQNNVELQAIPQSSMVAPAAPITDPFGTLPALPQMSIGQVGTTPSVQYGISNMHSGFGGQRGGSRIASYSATAEADSGTSGQTAKLASIFFSSSSSLTSNALTGFGQTAPSMSTPFQSAFEVSISHAFSASRSSTQAFGQSSSAFAPNTSTFFSRFGTSTPAFSSSAFGSSLSTSPPSIFGPSTSYPFCTCCHFHNTPCGQTCRFRNTLRGQTATLSQSSLFCSPSCGIFGGSQTPAPAFGNAVIMQSGFGGQEGGSIVASYSTTSINPFISTIPNSNRFASKTSTFFSGFGTSAPSFSSSAFVSSLSAAAPSIFGPSTSYLVCSCGRVHNTPCGQTADLSQSSLFSSPPCGLVGGSQTPAPAFGNTGIGWSGFGETLEKLEAISARLQTLFSQPCGQTAALSESTPKLASISTMVVYKDKSHEELRWEDYQLGNKGSPIPTSVFGLVLGSQDLEINRVEVE